MMTELLKESDLQRAANIIAGGGLVAFPTETVFGLGANAFDAGAVIGIFKAKGRPSDNPLIVHVADARDVARVAHPVPILSAVAEVFWPGPLTVVLKKRAVVPDNVTGGLDTVAVRVPDHAIARELIRLSGVPIVAPSANISGKPSGTSVAHVLADFDGRIDAVLMAESSRIGLESTVINLTVDPPVILRPGAISVEALRAVIPEIEVGRFDAGDPLISPGMKYRHYAPRARVWLFEESARNHLEHSARELRGEGKRVKIIETEASVSFASTLYDRLRHCDRSGITDIFFTSVTEEGIGLAIMNRIRKAAFRIMR